MADVIRELDSIRGLAQRGGWTAASGTADGHARRPGDSLLGESIHRARREFWASLSLESALRILVPAIEEADGNPLGHVAVAAVHCLAVETGVGSREAGLSAARQAASQVAGVKTPRADTPLAWLERLDGNLVTSMRHFEAAIRSDPSDVDALFCLGLSYSTVAGRFTEAAAVVNRLTEIDPSPANRVVRACCMGALDGWEASADALDEILRDEPGFKFAKLKALAWLGLTEEACAQAVDLEAEKANDVVGHAAGALAQALRGGWTRVVAFANGPLHSHLWHHAEWPWWLAGWLTLVREHEQAYTWLERWLDRGAINYPVLADLDPFFEPLRGELRFRRLLDRVKPAWEEFEPSFGPGSQTGPPGS